MTTPRNVARYRNAISVTWPAVADEVSLADFVALEALRLYEPSLFAAIRARQAEACGAAGNQYDNRSQEERLKPFLDDVPVPRRELAAIALQRLFPRLESAGYGTNWIPIWDAERRVCIEAHFDTYFRLTLSEETLPTKIREEMASRADDTDFIKMTMRSAAKTRRRNGKTMVPVSLTKKSQIINGHAVVDVSFAEGIIGTEEAAGVIGEQKIVAKLPKPEGPDSHDRATIRKRSRRMSIVSARIFSR